MFPIWGAIAAAAISAGSGIANMIKKQRLQSEWKSLAGERPDYTIPESYKSALGVYQKLATGEMPGQSLIEENIQQSSARARTAAERGSISSTAYGGQMSNIYDKELQAIQDLGIQAAQYKASAQENLAKGLQMMGAQEEKKYEWDVIGDWTTRMNQIEGQLGAATTNTGNWLNTAMQSLATTKDEDWTKIFSGIGGGGKKKNGGSSNPGGTFAEGE